MVLEAIVYAVVELVAYPILYVVGLPAVKIASLGRAKILPLSARGCEKEMRWYQFFVHRSGQRFWTPESVMFVGMFVLVALGLIAWLVWRLI
jgi:hypothetical protein